MSTWFAGSRRGKRRVALSCAAFLLPSGSRNTFVDSSPVTSNDWMSLGEPAVEVAPVSLMADGISPSNTACLTWSAVMPRDLRRLFWVEFSWVLLLLPILLPKSRRHSALFLSVWSAGSLNLTRFRVIFGGCSSASTWLVSGEYGLDKDSRAWFGVIVFTVLASTQLNISSRFQYLPVSS